MRGLLSFHPVDVRFFDEMIGPLAAGGKVNPERFVAEAVRLRKTWWQVRRHLRALESALAASAPPPPDRSANVWTRVRSTFDRFDFRPEEVSRLATRCVEPDLHLDGRPFLVGETSAARVAKTVDRYVHAQSTEEVEAIAKEQLDRLDAEIGKHLVPEDGTELSPDLLHRSDLLADLTAVRNLAEAARKGGTWNEGSSPGRPAAEVLREELAWRGVHLHSRIVPFWLGRDVDGLETVCRAAGVRPPDALVPARRLFAGPCEEFPSFGASLGIEILRPRQVGAFVPPEEVPGLNEFLAEAGARIIQVAAREGEGPACTTLLRKIRECTTYAAQNGLGYLEASGILPPDLSDAEST